MTKEFEEIAKFCNHEHCGEVCNLFVFVRKHFLPKSVVKRKIEKMIKNESCQHDQDGACYVKYGDLCSESYNLALQNLLKDLDL